MEMELHPCAAPFTLTGSDCCDYRSHFLDSFPFISFQSDQHSDRNLKNKQTLKPLTFNGYPFFYREVHRPKPPRPPPPKLLLALLPDCLWQASQIILFLSLCSPCLLLEHPSSPLQAQEAFLIFQPYSVTQPFNPLLFFLRQIKVLLKM